ncbi:hypothetical protein EBZ80_11395 [bacterium]|nr:hypothetical protein [bacterium]
MAGPADNSFANKIKRLRCRTLAIYRRNNATAPEQGPGGGVTDESTRQARRLGQQTEWRANAGNTVVTEIPPCCTAVGPS